MCFYDEILLIKSYNEISNTLVSLARVLRRLRTKKPFYVLYTHSLLSQSYIIYVRGTFFILFLIYRHWKCIHTHSRTGPPSLYRLEFGPLKIKTKILYSTGGKYTDVPFFYHVLCVET